ncbi:hypothetical protein LEMLEM_LOCUS3475, partial [Lemmus lemmus]
VCPLGFWASWWLRTARWCVSDPVWFGVPGIKSLQHHAKQEEPVFCPRGAEVKRETSQNRRISINTNKCSDCH